MPYVPSHKTVPPAEDRAILDPVIEVLAQKAATQIKYNHQLKMVYAHIFIKVADVLRVSFEMEKGYASETSPETNMAHTILQVAKKWGYWGAHSGELNYSITRFIQRVPQIKVAAGEWKDTDELRYWLYAGTVSALTYASRRTEEFGIDADGVYEDVKDEYKRRVNAPYEAAQILKSGDCYDTPYYTRLIEVVDENGKVIGHQEVMLKRSEETLHIDLLPWQTVVRKRPVDKEQHKPFSKN